MLVQQILFVFRYSATICYEQLAGMQGEITSTGVDQGLRSISHNATSSGSSSISAS